MELRKAFFFEHFFSALSSKRRVVSGFLLGVLASLLVLSLLLAANPPSPTTTSSSSSFLFWFFTINHGIGNGNSRNISSSFLAGGHGSNSSWGSVSGIEMDHNLVNAHGGNSSESGFAGEELDLVTAHEGNSTESGSSGEELGLAVGAKNYIVNSSKSGFSSEDPKNFTGATVLATAREANSSNSGLSGEKLNFGTTHAKNFTVPTVLATAREVNSSKSALSGKKLDFGTTHAKNFTEPTVLAAARKPNSSKSGHSGEELNFGTTHAKNFTGPTVLATAREANSLNSSLSGEELESGSSHAKNSWSPYPMQNVSKDDNKADVSGSVEATRDVAANCNIFNGRWVRDETKPYYPGGSCPYIDNDFNCHKNGRPDIDFLKWKWQPYDCDIPSLNATDFLARSRGKRILFVGDSLNRNMWESLVCILRHSIKRKSRVYEVSGRHDFKTKGYYSFKFEDYNCSVDYVRSPFLVRELYHKNAKGAEDEKLRLDLLDETTNAYRGADVLVFNTGHWWTHDKTSRGIDYYQEGNRVYPVLKVMEAYKKALATWATWVDKNIDTEKTEVVFRGYSLTHFRGGQWNSGGQCHKETEPIYNETFLAKYPAKMRALEPVLAQMKTPVIYLNISRLTDYRKDGHPSVYRKKYKTVDEQVAGEKSQDCSHWCLPGVPDTWNELLYASLLNEGKGSWKR